MYLEIISPEKVLLSAEVTSVSVPGVEGEFQMLNNHAPIVSVLAEGYVKVEGNIQLDEAVQNKFEKDGNRLKLPIKGGVLEMKNNKVVVLAD